MEKRNFIQRHAVIIYFALAYLIAWGGIFSVVGWDGLTGKTQDANASLPVIAAMFGGPCLAGILMTALAEGRAGLRGLWSRQRRWRVNWRWYVLALSITPVLFGGVLLSLALVSPVFVPGLFTTSDRVTLVALGSSVTFIVGLLEEIGWTGFATPALLRRHSTLATALIIGVNWGLWHFLPDWWGSAAVFGGLFAPHFLVWWLQLIAFRILMTWVYTHTQSLWVGQLMHASYTGSQAVLAPTTLAILNSTAASPADSVLWNTVFAVALWVTVAIVITAQRKRSVQSSVQGAFS